MKFFLMKSYEKFSKLKISKKKQKLSQFFRRPDFVPARNEIISWEKSFQKH